MLQPPEGSSSEMFAGRSTGPVVIFTDQAEWHFDRLVAALAKHGIRPQTVPLSEVAFDVGARAPLTVPGCGGRLPRAALVRGVPAGSFAAVTTRLGALEALQALGTTVWNDAASIRRCVDKSATSVALVSAGLPTPRTLVTESRARALDFLAREIGRGHEVVLKPLFGAQGRGLQRLSLARDLPDPDDVDGVYYLQRFVPPVGDEHRDYRVFVSAGRVVAGMVRRGTGWITNVHQGALPVPLAVDASMSALSLASARAVGARFCGVDLMDNGSGGYTVIEVNAMPAWRGLQTVADVDVAEALVSDWMAEAGLAARPALVGPGRDA